MGWGVSDYSYSRLFTFMKLDAMPVKISSYCNGTSGHRSHGNEMEALQAIENHSSHEPLVQW